MVMRCALVGCASSSKYDKERNFFRFPRDEMRRNQWIQASGRLDLAAKDPEILNKNYFLCDLHFPETDRLIKKLKINAVPTLNLSPQSNIGPCKETQTLESFLYQRTYSVSKATNTLLDFRYYNNAEKFNEALKGELNQRQSHQSATTNISPEFKILLDLKSRFQRPSNFYKKKFIMFALSLYLSSPLAYRVLAKSVSLPSENELRKKNINVGTKLYPHVATLIETKVSKLQEMEKYCVIRADEILLKSNLYYQISEDKIIGFIEMNGIQTTEAATTAVVIMAQGLFSDWQQPLVYWFLTENKDYQALATWLSDFIANIMNIGLNVVGFVSNQRKTFLNLAEELTVSADKPYFFVNGKKICYIFDVPHLVKSVRNALIKYDFEFNMDGTKMKAKWEDIEAFYRQDCARTYRLAPRLTDSHINPNKIEKTKVEYATQVFSKAVAAAMNFSILECDLLKNASPGTVKLISLMDKALDILNKSASRDFEKNKEPTVTKQNLEELEQIEDFLDNVTVLNKNEKDVTKSIKCLKGLRISVMAIRNLLLDMQYLDYHVLTGRLNNGALDVFCGTVRRKGKNICKPTPIKFYKAFRKLFMDSIMKCPKTANSSNFGKIISDINVMDQELKKWQCQLDKISTSSVKVGTVDYRFEVPEANSFRYICDYLFRKCFGLHRCSGINGYMQSIKDHENAKNCDPSKVTVDPLNIFISCVQAMDDTVKQFLQQDGLRADGIGNQLLTELNDIYFTGCCKCFPNHYLKRLFIRFRIFNIIKFNNKLFKERALKQEPQD